jgi:major type 1 subunit fimbrin (pilin)
MTTLSINPHVSRRIGSIVIQLLMLALVLLYSLGAKAALPVCTASGTAFTVNMPPTLVVPRDVAVGQPLTSWSSVSAPNLWTCTNVNNNSDYWNAGLAISAGSALGGSIGTYSESGLTYPLFATGVPGIAVVMGFDLTRSGNCTTTTALPVGSSSALSGIPAGWATGGCYWFSQTGNTQVGGTFRVRLIRTAGTVTAQALNGSAVAISQAYAGGPAASIPTWASLQGAPVVVFGFTPVNIVVGACSTPDVIVPMKTHSTNELTGPNSFTSSVSFNINLNNCPAGMNTIQYRIDPTTAVAIAAQSVVTLDSSSGATGIGVQLLNGAGTAAFPLSSYQTFSGYNSATGGNYSIPFQARYYQTGSTIAAGAANTSMTVMLNYQ